MRRINIEDGEILQYPSGATTQAQGNSHEQGGINTTVPEGTKVYSDRIKVGEHTMAERKAWRSKKITDILSTPSLDPIVNNTKKRTLDWFRQLEQHDLAIQDAANNAATEAFAFGTGPGGVGGNFMTFPKQNDAWKYDYYRYFPEAKTWYGVGEKNDLHMITTPNTLKLLNETYSPMSAVQDITPSTEGIGELPDGTVDIAYKTFDTLPSLFSEPPVPTMNPSSTPKPAPAFTPPVTGKEEMGLSTGDWVALGSSIIGNVAQTVNTIQNAKNTQPVKNRFLGVNDSALISNNAALDELAYDKERALETNQRNINLQTATARKGARGSATSLNTLRALDLGIDMNADQALVQGNDQLDMSFGQQKVGLLNNRTSLLSEKSKLIASDQARVDEANAANLDAFYTNFGKNLADMTETGQVVGKQMNQTKYNNTFLNILPETNKWGIGINEDGSLYFNGKNYKPTAP